MVKSVRLNNGYDFRHGEPFVVHPHRKTPPNKSPAGPVSAASCQHRVILIED